MSADNGLSARHIVVTRAAHQAGVMAGLLRDRGAIPVLYPCIEIGPPDDLAPLDEALGEAAAGHYDWLVITSTNTVQALAGRLEAMGFELAGVSVAAIGPGTAAAVERRLRIDVNLVAPEFRAEALATSLGVTPNRRVLLPQSAIARPLLANSLRAAGADLTVVEAYRSRVGRGGEDVPARLASGQIDAITFTSASTVKGFLERLETEGGHRAHLDGLSLAAIGPVTAGTMEKMGLRVSVMPADYTIPALVEALAQYFSEDDRALDAPTREEL